MAGGSWRPTTACTASARALQLDHYLELLADKPGAFSGSLHQARERGEFPACNEELWRRLRARVGEKAGTRALIDLLLLHRRHPRALVVEAVAEALAVGTIDPSAVGLLCRHGTEGRWSQPTLIDVGERPATTGRFRISATTTCSAAV